jgi:transcriptional regulator with XRE-family HTH domain
MKKKPIHPLTRWRFENGQMSLAALGKKVKASAPHLSDIENRTKNPSVGLLTRLTDYTKLPMEQIARAS